MAQKKINIAVAGATGAVGNQMIRCLEEMSFPTHSVQLLASSRSVGRQLRFKGDLIDVKEMKADSFKGIDIALFSAGGGTSEKFAPFAAKDGCVVIDNSSAWRMDPQVPLVVPEVNSHAIAQHTEKRHYCQSELLHDSDGGSAASDSQKNTVLSESWFPPIRRYRAQAKKQLMNSLINRVR